MLLVRERKITKTVGDLFVNGQTTRIVECKKFADLAEYCLYENACLYRDGIYNYSFLYFTNDDKRKENVTFEHKGQTLLHREVFEPLDQFGNVIERAVNNPLPFRSFLKGAYVSSRLVDKLTEIIYEDGCHAVLQLDAESVQIFHWAIKVSLLFIFRLANQDSLCREFVKIKILNRLSGLDRNEWQDNFLKMAANVTDEQIEYEDIAPMYKIQMKCYKRLLVPGQARYIFTGPTESIEFRKEAAKRYGLVYERSKVIFVVRRDRVIVNQRELELYLCSKLNRELIEIVYLEDLSFEQQLKLMSKASLLISVHGAALTNVIFMPKMSALIEITPPIFPSTLYERIALQSYHTYFKFATDFQPSIHDAANYKFCTNRANLYEYYCFIVWRDAQVYVNISKFSIIFEKVLEIL